MADHRLSQISTASSNNSKRGKSYIGPWQLGKTLGSGSSGRVRPATHSETGQLAAVKIVAKSQFSSSKESKHGRKPSESYGIEREVIIMKLIEHPNVMALYDVWENKGELYLVLEYVEGGELFDYLISRGKLSESEAIHYFRQICFGVDYCHKFNICHRDLKPENLLLDKNRNIKIADFGMAALESDERLLETSCGSPHYASPEIVTGQTYHGAPSDIWSCGIILFALLSGHLPFDDDNIRHLLMKVQSGRYKMPHSLSPEARDLISRMLVVDPKRRITMPEILRHPLLRKHPSSKIPKENLIRHNKLDVSQPILNIDRDILRNLQTLWHHDTKEMLISKLQSPEANVEKTFYALLLKFRKKHGITEKNVIPRNKSVASMKSLNSSRSITSFASNKSISHQRSASVKSALSGRSNISLRSRRLTQRRQTRHSHRSGGNDSRTNSQADKLVKNRNRESLQTEAFADMLERAFNQSSKPNEVRAISNPNPVTNNNTVSPSLSAYSNQKRVISAPAPYTSTNYSANYGNYSPQTRSANPYNEPSFGTPPTSAGSAGSAGSAVSGNSRNSAASTLNGNKESYLLPMIFEEDKFAMNLEEEINEKVEVIGYSSNQKKVAAPKREAPPKPVKTNAPKSTALTGPPLTNTAHKNSTQTPQLADSQPQSNNYTDLGLSTPVPPTPPTLPDFNEPQARSTSTLATANSKRNTQRKPVPIYIDESSDSSMEKLEDKIQQPTSPFERKPLQPIDTSNKQSGYEQLILPKTNRQVQRAQEMKTQPKEKERHNWIRRFTPSLTSRRTSKEIKDKERTQLDKENVNVMNEEPHQNWVMKLFSSSQAPKVMYAPQPTFALRNTLLKTFADWSKFGLQVTETSKSKPFTITILPANSLRLKSAKIEVQLSRKTSVLSMVKLVFRKGSRQSYSTFSDEVERRLREMKIVL